MSSTIKLYEHNQKAYDALLDMLGERDRACVIKPTGTGKFVIIAKMVQDNPDKRFLLLGTNDYMFNDQMANLTEIAPGFTPENLQFMTYSAAMMAARRGEEISSYDVVVADEFHHCGAEEWGKGVTHILDANESAIPRLREIFAGADEVIGYNIGFDLGFLSAVGVRPREDAIITDGTAKGLHFYYADEPEPDDLLPSKRGIRVRCVETGVVYKTITQAAKETGASQAGICGAASGMAGGYRWEYVDD